MLSRFFTRSKDPLVEMHEAMRTMETKLERMSVKIKSLEAKIIEERRATSEALWRINIIDRENMETELRVSEIARLMDRYFRG
jgi:uncharacterized protein YaaN involved in tellurite resistance